MCERRSCSQTVFLGSVLPHQSIEYACALLYGLIACHCSAWSVGWHVSSGVSQICVFDPVRGRLATGFGNLLVHVTSPKVQSYRIVYLTSLARLPIFQAGGDVWCSSSEFLTLNAGDWEEHAVLLCNYFKVSSHSVYHAQPGSLV